MKHARYAALLLMCAGAVAAAAFGPGALTVRWQYLLVVSAFIALVRLIAGPTMVDRTAAMKVISVIIFNSAIILGVVTGNDLYIDIAIAWAFQAFIGTLVFAKHGEGKKLDA